MTITQALYVFTHQREFDKLTVRALSTRSALRACSTKRVDAVMTFVIP